MIVRAGAPGHARVVGTIARGRSANAKVARLPRPAPAADDAWMADAACARTDPALFFAPEWEKPRDRDRREFDARRVCAACPVKAACKAYAEADPGRAEYGVWGGLTEYDRGRAHAKKRDANARRRARRASETAAASTAKTAPELPVGPAAAPTGAVAVPASPKPAKGAQRGRAAVTAGVVP